MKYKEYAVTIKLGGITHLMDVRPQVSEEDWRWMTVQQRHEHIYQIAKGMVLELMSIDLGELEDGSE